MKLFNLGFALVLGGLSLCSSAFAGERALWLQCDGVVQREVVQVKAALSADLLCKELQDITMQGVPLGNQSENAVRTILNVAGPVQPRFFGFSDILNRGTRTFTLSDEYALSIPMVCGGLVDGPKFRGVITYQSSEDAPREKFECGCSLSSVPNAVQ